MTETTPTGPPESVKVGPSAEDRLKAVDAELDEFERQLGLPKVLDMEVEQAAKRLLNLPPSVLRKMTAVEAGEGAYILRQFAKHLQRACNREQGRARWCEENIKAVIARTVHQYRGASFEERKLQAVRENEAAAALDGLRVRATLRVERISYLSAKAGDLAETLRSLQFSKKGEKTND